MFNRSVLALGTIVVFFTLLLVWQIADEAAADQTLIGDLVVGPGTVSYKDETIDVSGNVIVSNGGILKLENCTLAINASDNGQFRLEVEAGGTLEATRSTLYGNRARIMVKFSDDVTLVGCTISHVFNMGYDYGIVIDGGLTTIRDSTISDCSYHALVISSDMRLSNVTIKDITYTAIYVSNYNANNAYSVQADGCHLIGSGTSWYVRGVYLLSYSNYPQANLLVTNTKIEGFHQGVSAYTSGGSVGIFEDCEIVGNDQGFNISQTAGSLTLRNNLVGRDTSSNSVGIYMRLSESMNLLLENNTIEQVDSAYYFLGPWTGGWPSATLSPPTATGASPPAAGSTSLCTTPRYPQPRPTARSSPCRVPPSRCWTPTTRSAAARPTTRAPS